MLVLDGPCPCERHRHGQRGRQHCSGPPCAERLLKLAERKTCAHIDRKLTFFLFHWASRWTTTSQTARAMAPVDEIQSTFADGLGSCVAQCTLETRGGTRITSAASWLAGASSSSLPATSGSASQLLIWQGRAVQACELQDPDPTGHHSRTIQFQTISRANNWSWRLRQGLCHASWSVAGGGKSPLMARRWAGPCLRPLASNARCESCIVKFRGLKEPATGDNAAISGFFFSRTLQAVLQEAAPCPDRVGGGPAGGS